MKITILKDVIYDDKLILKKDEVFEFNSLINLISGTNGSGKTTLLTAIRMLDKEENNNFLISRTELKGCLEIDGDYNFYSFFAAEDDSHGAAMMDMSSFLKLGGMERSNKSQGESTLIQLMRLLTKLKESNTKNNIILLDEIDRTLDYKMQLKLKNIIINFAGYGHIIYSTHNYLLLSKRKSFNFDERKMMTYKELIS